ncbi:unnamed protein product [Spirodela intermedia]|uniref:Uncharacterized protein n=2 Tax=Spirodela intermedia TaxID=51605 RepID=A0A7I8KM58_SPIIN|nr:unnamed protein product [Spirodela intermedia]CAA6662455.1 unnamed protein product [Spirodela intermedia]CAA7398853.1 unnamed protein product [Spirodela intermedia]
MPKGLERLAWIDRGTCAPLPFHVTGGQPAVGQGVVVHRTTDLGLNPRHTFLRRGGRPTWVRVLLESKVIYFYLIIMTFLRITGEGLSNENH